MGRKKKDTIHIKPSEVGSLRAIARREGGILSSGLISVTWAKKKLSDKRTRESTKKKIRFFLNSRKWKR